MIVEFSKEDLLTSKIVEPAWYRVQIDSIEDRMSNDGKSTNTWLKGHIIMNADTGDVTNAGVPTPYLWMFNSKAAWSMVGFAQAFGADVKPGSRFDPAATTGQQVDVFIDNEMYNGVLQNSMKKGMYRTPRS